MSIEKRIENQEAFAFISEEEERQQKIASEMFYITEMKRRIEALEKRKSEKNWEIILGLERC